MWDDRVFDAGATITHDFLALLLGVTRPGVTIALHELEGKGLIRSTRSHVRILDRDGLRGTANDFYGVRGLNASALSVSCQPHRSGENGNPAHDPPSRPCPIGNLGLRRQRTR
jgi:Crp-like helix-turn-helix domain